MSQAATETTLLRNAAVNIGTAFNDKQRKTLALTGLLPAAVESLPQQVARVYHQYQACATMLDKYQLLRAVQDDNETLFYATVATHLFEMMPVIYTPTVGEACEQFSAIYQRPRGLFLAYPDRAELTAVLALQPDDIQVIVVTDGSRILGLGDQGAGGMGIPIGKLALYTACGGIDPTKTLPIMLDLGTNNPSLLEDKFYIGWREKRVTGAAYDAFLDDFIQAVKQRWPNVLLQFEDFSQQNAMPLLTRYRDQLCCFNDDIQGTAAVTVGALLAACHAKDETLSAQRIVFAGAGSAGCGIAEQLVATMCAEGLSYGEARAKIYMIDRDGLLTQAMMNLQDFQKNLAQAPAALANWALENDYVGLLDVVREAKPTILIGVSGQTGLFTQTLIETMAASCPQPIIFPLSNPSKQIEAVPADLLRWTDGKALIATGSPFEPVRYGDAEYAIPQCNNSYIFPGIGLAVIVGGISRITEDMLMVASNVLAAASPLVQTGQGALLPALTEIAEVSKQIAFAVVQCARENHLGAAGLDDAAVKDAIDAQFWLAEYNR